MVPMLPGIRCDSSPKNTIDSEEISWHKFILSGWLIGSSVP
jgi:hypothetical protein